MTLEEYQALPKTNRGWCVFGEVPCRDGTLRVWESSLAGEGAHARLHLVEPAYKDASGHFGVPQAKALVAALQQFIDAAESGMLTEPAETRELEEER
jgi:hypothetical protein